MNVQKEARRDAKEYARAQMFYGEGAGTRRKLIFATVESKMDKDPQYAAAFNKELDRQDMAEHATKARHERERTDRKEAIKKNTKAVMTGNYQNAQAGVLILIVLGYVAHQTGLDQKVIAKSKQYYWRAKVKYRQYQIKKMVDKQTNNPHH